MVSFKWLHLVLWLMLHVMPRVHERDELQIILIIVQKKKKRKKVPGNLSQGHVPKNVPLCLLIGPAMF